jgi:hypothetical protein
LPTTNHQSSFSLFRCLLVEENYQIIKLLYLL